jgi:hypothetical protein
MARDVVTKGIGIDGTPRSIGSAYDLLDSFKEVVR